MKHTHTTANVTNEGIQIINTETASKKTLLFLSLANAALVLVVGLMSHLQKTGRGIPIPTGLPAMKE